VDSGRAKEYTKYIGTCKGSLGVGPVNPGLLHLQEQLFRTIMIMAYISTSVVNYWFLLLALALQYTGVYSQDLIQNYSLGGSLVLRMGTWVCLADLQKSRGMPP